jgi:uncharacterized protein YndB with AHSA1/START domain
MAVHRKNEATHASLLPGGFDVSLPSDRQILMTRTFGAPRAVVFEAWTRAEHVRQWWDPSGAPLQHCTIDLRPGGRFRFVHQASLGGHAFEGVYEQVSPPERLVLRVEFAGGKAVTSTLVFTDQGSRTGFAMTMDCALREDRDMLLAMKVDEGTGRTLANLEQFLLSLQSREP